MKKLVEIEDIIKGKESKTLEFKRDLSSFKPIMKTLVAFANTAGGTLVIGWDDNGVITGQNSGLLLELLFILIPRQLRMKQQMSL